MQKLREWAQCCGEAPTADDVCKLLHLVGLEVQPYMLPKMFAEHIISNRVEQLYGYAIGAVADACPVAWYDLASLRYRLVHSIRENPGFAQHVEMFIQQQLDERLEVHTVREIFNLIVYSQNSGALTAFIQRCSPKEFTALMDVLYQQLGGQEWCNIVAGFAQHTGSQPGDTYYNAMTQEHMLLVRSICSDTSDGVLGRLDAFLGNTVVSKTQHSHPMSFWAPMLLQVAFAHPQRRVHEHLFAWATSVGVKHGIIHPKQLRRCAETFSIPTPPSCTTRMLPTEATTPRFDEKAFREVLFTACIFGEHHPMVGGFQHLLGPPEHRGVVVVENITPSVGYDVVDVVSSPETLGVLTRLGLSLGSVRAALNSNPFMQQGEVDHVMRVVHMVTHHKYRTNTWGSDDVAELCRISTALGDQTPRNDIDIAMCRIAASFWGDETWLCGGADMLDHVRAELPHTLMSECARILRGERSEKDHVFDENDLHNMFCALHTHFIGCSPGCDRKDTHKKPHMVTHVFDVLADVMGSSTPWLFVNNPTINSPFGAIVLAAIGFRTLNVFAETPQQSGGAKNHV